MTFVSPHTRPRSARRAASLLAGALLTGAGAAHAQTYGTTVVAPSQSLAYSFSTTTTTSSPTYNRVAIAGGLNTYNTANPAGLSSIGSAVTYATSGSFIPTTTGTYTINTSATGFDGGNYIQYIYQPALVTSSPTTGVQYGYYPGNATNSGTYNVNLTAGVANQFVDAGYYSNNATYPQVPGNGYYSEGTATTNVYLNNYGSQTVIADPTKTVVGTGSNATATYTPVASTQNLTVADTTTITSFNSITIVGLSHSYIGDLLGTLSHNGVTVDLFDHVGASAANYGNGSAASFDGNNYTFSLAGANLGSVADFTSAPDGTTYMASSNTSSGYDTSASNANTLNSFVGQSVAGVWTLSITDEQPDDSGAFLGFNFNINNVAAAPEPSQFAALAVGALGIGGLMLRARRRRMSA